MQKLLLFTLIVALCATVHPACAAAAQPPIVYAHYMHCYILGAMANKGQFNNGESPLRTGVTDATNWPEFEQAVRGWWAPELAPLAQSGIEAVRKDFDMAGEAGLDALGLLISNAHLPNSQFAGPMRLAAQVAMTHRVKIIPDLWPSALTRDQWQQYGVQVKTYMDAYPGAFLTYQGKPVISLGNPLNYGRAVAKARGEKYNEWDAVQAFFTPWGGPEKCYKILSITWNKIDLDGGYREAVEAYSIWTASYGWGDQQHDVIATQAKSDGKAISWPVNAAYYGCRTGVANSAESLGVSRCCDQWRRAIAQRTAFATVQSWNDMSEDHAITNTNYRGRTLMELTRYFADWFHTGKAPKINQEKIFLFHHRQLFSAKLSEATIYARSDQWHLTPDSDYLNVVTMLKKAGTVRVQVGGDAWTLDAPAGLHEWLVYVPSTRTEMGAKREAFNHGASSYPTSDANRTVTVATRIPGGTPVATLSRQGKTLVSVTSRLPLADTGRWQDLSMVGTMATVPVAR